MECDADSWRSGMPSNQLKALNLSLASTEPFIVQDITSVMGRESNCSVWSVLDWPVSLAQGSGEKGAFF